MAVVKPARRTRQARRSFGRAKRGKRWMSVARNAEGDTQGCAGMEENVGEILSTEVSDECSTLAPRPLPPRSSKVPPLVVSQLAGHAWPSSALSHLHTATPTTASFQSGLVLTAMCVVSAIQARFITAEGRSAAVWDTSALSREEKEEERNRRRTMRLMEEERRRRMRAAAKRVDAKASEEELQRIAKEAAERQEERERIRLKMQEEREKKVFEEQETAQKELERRREEAARRREKDEALAKERALQLEEERLRREEEEEKQRLEREALLAKLNESNPLPASGTNAKESNEFQTDSRAAVMTIWLAADVHMGRMSAADGNPQVEITLSPSGDTERETISGRGMSVNAILESLDSLVMMAADTSAAVSTSQMRTRALMGEGPLGRGEVDDHEMKHAARLAFLSALEKWPLQISAVINESFSDILGGGESVAFTLEDASVVWPREGPMEPRGGRNGERLTTLIKGAAITVSDSADESRALKLLKRAVATSDVAHGRLIPTEMGKLAIPFFVMAHFCERVEALITLKVNEAETKAESQRKRGRGLTASYKIKYMEEQKAAIQKRTKVMATSILNLDDALAKQALSQALSDQCGWAQNALKGCNHPLLSLLNDMVGGTPGNGEQSDKPVDTFDTLQDKKARYAAIREESAPVAERIWALKNVAATFKGTGALSEARKMLERAIDLKLSHVSDMKESTDSMVYDACVLDDLYELTELLQKDDEWSPDGLKVANQLVETGLVAMDRLLDMQLGAEACAMAVLISYLVSDVLERFDEDCENNEKSAFESLEKSLDALRSSGAKVQRSLSESEIMRVTALIESGADTMNNITTRLGGSVFRIAAQRRPGDKSVFND